MTYGGSFVYRLHTGAAILVLFGILFAADSAVHPGDHETLSPAQIISRHHHKTGTPILCVASLPLRFSTKYFNYNFVASKKSRKAHKARKYGGTWEYDPVNITRLSNSVVETTCRQEWFMSAFWLLQAVNSAQNIYRQDDYTNVNTIIVPLMLAGCVRRPSWNWLFALWENDVDDFVQNYLPHIVAQNKGQAMRQSNSTRDVFLTYPFSNTLVGEKPFHRRNATNGDPWAARIISPIIQALKELDPLATTLFTTIEDMATQGSSLGGAPRNKHLPNLLQIPYGTCKIFLVG
jgi:hypothetical protein